MIAHVEAAFRKGAEPDKLPPVPYELEHVWTRFRELSDARSVGMAANPISFCEIEAYCRLTLTPMTAWEVQLIRRLDKAALTTDREKATKPDPNAPPEPVPVENVKGLKALFRSMAAKKKAEGKG